MQHYLRVTTNRKIYILTFASLINRKLANMAFQKLAPVTHENLKQIFTSRNFLRGIRKATNTGLKRHTESQFSAWRGAFSEDITYFFPDRATYDMPFSTSFELEPKQYEQIDNQKLMPIIQYHCHPSPYVSPSEQDLVSHFDIRNQYNLIGGDESLPQSIENYHLDCIGAIRESGKFHDLLVLQNRLKTADSMEGEFAYQQIIERLGRQKDDNALLAKALDGLTNWNAHLLTYEKKGNSYDICDDQLSGLGKFAYTPILDTSS